ncbi:MAG: hypothetical protein U0Y82_03435 [Thermoleophilia bacterium]
MRLVTCGVCVLAAVASPLAASAATAPEPLPEHARIVEGAAMAGLRITATDAILARWGVQCVEGSCGWEVAGKPGQRVGYSYADVPGVLFMTTTVPGWVTRAGIHPGSTVAELRAAYGARLRPADRCLPNGMLTIRSVQHGFALITGTGPWRYTFFRTGRPAHAVRQIVVGRTAYAPPPAGRCIDDVP